MPGEADNDDENGEFAAEECERDIVEGECLDDFDLEEADSEDVEKFSRAGDDPSDEIEV